MSFDAFVWAWDQKLAKDEHLIVLLTLANIANENHEVYAGQPYIAAMARKEERTVRRALIAMRDMAPSPITIRARPGFTDVITLNIPEEFTVKRRRPPDGGKKRGRPRTLDLSAESPGHGGEKPPPKESDDPKTEPEIEPMEANASVGQADEVRQAFEAYNWIAERIGASRAERLNDDRKRRLKARIKDAGGLEGWYDALRRIEGSPFLTGQTHHHFGLTLDFILQPSSFTKLIEGRYEDRPNGGSPASPAGTDYAADRATTRTGAMVDGARQAVTGGRRRWQL